MIVWCRECNENWLQVTPTQKDRCPCDGHTQELFDWELQYFQNEGVGSYSFQEQFSPERCAGFFSPEAIAERWPNNTEPEGRYPYSLETISALLEGEWEPFGVVPRPTPEYNTVNLKELRELRDDVRHYVVYGY